MVKPHGHTYWLASYITALPHPAYQPRSLRGPFSELKAQGRTHLEGASRLDAFSGYPVRT